MQPLITDESQPLGSASERERANGRRDLGVDSHTGYRPCRTSIITAVIRPLPAMIPSLGGDPNTTSMPPTRPEDSGGRLGGWGALAGWKLTA
jgi:hypothetical protein